MQHSVPDLHLALLPAAQEAGRLGGTTGPDLSRYFLVCAILIAVTAGVAWGLKKLLAHNLQTRASQRSLKVLDVLGLGGKRQVAVVRCYDRTFILGLGEREVSPIAELDPVIGSDEAPEAPRPADRAAFAQALEQVRKALPKSLQPGGRSEAPAPAFATAHAGAQPLVEDAIEPSLQAELERRYQAASERLAATGTTGAQATGNVQPYLPPSTTQQPVQTQYATTEAPSAAAAPAPKKRVLRKVIRKRSQEESDRARSVASAALEMAATMKRERAAAAQRSASALAAHVQAADAVPAPLPAPASAQAAPSHQAQSPQDQAQRAQQQQAQSPPTLRLEGVLG